MRTGRGCARHAGSLARSKVRTRHLEILSGMEDDTCHKYISV